MRYEVSKVIKQNLVMELVFGNSSNPRKILGRHFVDNGQVISAYHPDATEMILRDENGDEYKMDQIERQPVYSVYFPKQDEFAYEIIMKFPDGNTFEISDPYSVPCQISKSEEEMFLNGTWLHSYKKMGAHPMTINGVKGIYFAVWAPSARRVSIVGDFNYWNGMLCPMNKLEDSGIFELFLPGLTPGNYYKFELKLPSGEVIQKADPCGRLNQIRSGDSSRVADMNSYEWHDESWMKARSKRFGEENYLSIADYTHTLPQEDLLHYNYDMFTHVLVSGTLGRRNYHSWTDSGVYSLPFENISQDLIKYMIDNLHQKGVGVILRCDFGYFNDHQAGLVQFDGRSLYGLSDARKDYNTERQKYRYCYPDITVRGYLYSAMKMWIDEYHIDGFVYDNQAESMFPSWNYDADHEAYRKSSIEFYEKSYQLIKNYDPGILVLGDSSGIEGFGNRKQFASHKFFDYYIDHKLNDTIKNYLQLNEYDRRVAFNNIVVPFQDCGNMKIITTINNWNYAEASSDQKRIYRMISAFLTGYPGIKRFRMDVYIDDGKNETMQDLFEINHKYPALRENQYGLDFFEWINGLNAKHEVISYMRKTEGGDTLIFVANLSPERKEGYYVGVPKLTEYELIFDSAREEKLSRHPIYSAVLKAMDLRKQSLKIDLEAYQTLIFRY